MRTSRVMLRVMPKDVGERKGVGVSPGGARRVPREDDVRILTPRQIYEHSDRYVIGQEAAKRAVATAAHQHLKRVAQRGLVAETRLRNTTVLRMGAAGAVETRAP